MPPRPNIHGRKICCQASMIGKLKRELDHCLPNRYSEMTLAVVFGLMGGAIIFGFAGMLFAIPAIMVGKVVITTMFRQFRAHNTT